MTSGCKLWVLMFACFFLSFFTSIHGDCGVCRHNSITYSTIPISPSYTSLNWNKSTDCCKWEGVECDGVGHAISLSLDNKNISSEDWKSIFKLQYLEELDLSRSSFGGIAIPEELYNLTRLKYLNLSRSSFMGQIPIGLSKLTSLVTLELSSDWEVELKNPGVLFQNLTHLKQLYLDGVEISAGGNAWCNAFSSLSKLQVLSLTDCQLSGPILPSLSNLSSLTSLQLDLNPLDTTIPNYFSNFTIGLSKLTSLVTLDLSSHFGGLEVKNPGVIFQNLTQLKQLYLDEIDISAGENGFPSLSKLQVLSLQDCQLSGPILPSLSNLTQLEQLYLDANHILAGGNVWCNAFSSMSKLQVLSLTYCQLSGPILPSLSNLSSLTSLQLDHSPLDTAIPDHFSNFTNLKILSLQETGLLGQFPQKIFLILTLENLNLSGNPLLGGSLPMQFPETGSLKQMTITNTNFSGSIPSSLFALPSLKSIQLSNNHFDGDIEDFQIASSSSLVELDLSSNNFIGSIPKSFFYLKSLQALDLSFNSFNGTLRLDMFNKFKNLTYLYISHNNLSIDASCSTTSTCLSSFPQLYKLGLASCNLKMFPDLRNQTSITHLDLSLNSITQKIPNWIWSIGNNSLMQVNLSCNLLEGLQKPYHIPESLDMLDLHANLLKGEIPVPKLGGWSASYLDYSNNNFSTSIPSNIGKYIFNTKFFSLSRNNIQGNIPKSICNGTSLYVLDFSNNFLRGKIPKCLFGMVHENFGVLNLGGNKLGGHISNTFHRNCGLKTLDLNRNNLRGKIPTSLANCKSLEVFNVGNNYLEDNFPCTLMKYLTVLVLRFNMFHGQINCSWGIHSFPSLQILDVSHNNFSGALPPQLFFNCRGMIVVNRTKEPFYLSATEASYQDNVKLVVKGLEVEFIKILTIYKTLDFSCNNFQGNIPSTIGELLALCSLNLSQNALTGIIPSSFGKLEQLESLDLSTNQLTGIIPSGLGDLTFLSVMNLSYNHLIGKIPSGRQLQTFPNSSFLGNKGLCGFPLTVSCDHDLPTNGSSVLEGASKKKEIDWEFVSAALGFSVGIGIILWMNFLNPAWWRRFNSLIIEFLFLRVFGVDVLERSYRNPIRRV